jgi:phage terminase large subunit-like protein
MRLCYPDVPYTLNRTDWFVEFFNKSTIIFGGLDEKERTEKVLGQEFCGILFNESSQITYSARNKALTRLAQEAGLPLRAWYDANPPSQAHWTYRLFIRGVEPTSGARVEDPSNYIALQMNPVDNQQNLSPGYIKQLESLPEKERRRFLHGEWLAQVDNALWAMDGLDTCRISSSQLPDMIRVVVGVDPSGASGPEDERSDEIGIVVVGTDRLGKGYVLDDLSGHYSPQGWARAALHAFDRWGADRIVAERNFGGAMVESTIRAERATASVKLVTASRGKAVRAEPVAALYEQGRMLHVGAFADLEEQLTNFSTAGYQGSRSPDRADAMVWAATELLLEKQGVALIAV